MSPAAKKSACKTSAKKAKSACCAPESMAAKTAPKKKTKGGCGTRRCG